MADPYTNPPTRAPNHDMPATDAKGVTTAVSDAAGEVAGTAREQGGQVADEARSQARRLATEARDRVGEQARAQSDRLVDAARRIADELDEMSRDRGESPATTVVSTVATGSRKFADHLANRGPDQILAEIGEFARRRPGAFLATAFVSGLVIGRLGKGVLDSTGAHPDTDRDRQADEPAADETAAGNRTSGDEFPVGDRSGYRDEIGVQDDDAYPGDVAYHGDVAIGAAAVPPANLVAGQPGGWAATPDYPAAAETYPPGERSQRVTLNQPRRDG